MTAYVEATLRLRPAGADGAYPVEIELDDGARFEDGRLTLDPIALKAAQQNAAEYGRLLFAAVFTGGVRDAYLAAGARAQAQTAGRLRVRLRIDARAAELHALAWERLYHPSRGQSAPLATAVDTPFSRYTSLAIADFQPVSERPLRMLVAVANPANLAQLGLTPVDLEAELETVRQAVEPLTQAGKLVVTLLPGGAGLPPALAQKLTAAHWELAAGATTLEAIKRRLPGQHIFHFIGHGALARGSAQGEGTAALYLENDAGQSERVPDSELDATLKA
ncbi:MAG: hypothetical protein KA764_18385, partial [Anaerolineales bacterium]|nr:hypothetical protein [Anaerolineales bacterium]